MKEGDIVEHILDKEWLLVLKVKGDKVTCRTKSFEVIEFHDFELRPRI